MLRTERPHFVLKDKRPLTAFTERLTYYTKSVGQQSGRIVKRSGNEVVGKRRSRVLSAKWSFSKAVGQRSGQINRTL
ncbi:MAG: hypothetical protein SOT07_02605 [Paludibacteraceae bacterium]|nr:hypothetical protein [Paludibacteraceae bacterium]